MYQRQVWKDHVVEFPNRFQETNLGNGLVNEVQQSEWLGAIF